MKEKIPTTGETPGNRDQTQLLPRGILHVTEQEAYEHIRSLYYNREFSLASVVEFARVFYASTREDIIAAIGEKVIEASHNKPQLPEIREIILALRREHQLGGSHIRAILNRGGYSVKHKTIKEALAAEPHLKKKRAKTQVVSEKEKRIPSKNTTTEGSPKYVEVVTLLREHPDWSNKLIGHKAGIAAKDVRTIRIDQGIAPAPKGKPRPVSSEIIRALRREGKSKTKIAEILGIHHERVSRELEKYGENERLKKRNDNF